MIDAKIVVSTCVVIVVKMSFDRSTEVDIVVKTAVVAQLMTEMRIVVKYVTATQF